MCKNKNKKTPHFIRTGVIVGLKPQEKEIFLTVLVLKLTSSENSLIFFVGGHSHT